MKRKQILTTIISILIIIITAGLISGYFSDKIDSYKNKESFSATEKLPNSKIESDNISSPENNIEWKKIKNDEYAFEIDVPQNLNFSDDKSIFENKENSLIGYFYGEEGLEYYKNIQTGNQFCEGDSCFPFLMVYSSENINSLDRHFKSLEKRDYSGINEIKEVLSKLSIYEKIDYNSIICGNYTMNYIIASYEDMFFMNPDKSIGYNDDIFFLKNDRIYELSFSGSLNNGNPSGPILKRMADSFICSLP